MYGVPFLVVLRVESSVTTRAIVLNCGFYAKITRIYVLVVHAVRKIEKRCGGRCCHDGTVGKHCWHFLQLHLCRRLRNYERLEGV